MNAISIHESGGPDVLGLEDIDVPQPKADEVSIKVYAGSVNRYRKHPCLWSTDK